MCIRDSSNNMILLDRKQSRCPNGLVFGTPGSGKSMSCKREITFIILTTKDNVIICDPEDEYSPLVKRLGGQVIRLSPSSTDYVNPLDINLNYSDEENPLALKSDFVLSFCELIMGSKTGLEAIEKTVIDRAVQKIYQPYFADPRPENMPILGDLMEALLAQGIPCLLYTSFGSIEKKAMIPRYYGENIDYLNIGFHQIAYPMICSVSYTHLDVYKRQLLSCAASSHSFPLSVSFPA